MRTLATFCLVLFFSCDRNPESQAALSSYYALDSLINGQIDLLVDQKRMVQKTVWLNGVQDDTIISFSREAWEDELKLFIEADINTPANDGVYLWEKGLDDPGSNLYFDRYIPKQDFEPAIKQFEIYYYETLDQVKKIAIVASEENELYFSNKYLSINFESSKGGPIISSYSIAGEQRLILRDSVQYRIDGKLVMN